MVLDNTYLEEVILSLFHINVANLIINKVQLAKNFHIQPSEIDKMAMWEYELFMKELNKIVKKENKDQQDEQSKYNVKKMTNPNNMRQFAQQNGIKIPSMSSMKPSSIGSIHL